MILGDHAATLWCRVKRDTSLVDERPQLRRGVRPQDTTAGNDHRLLSLAERRDSRINQSRLGMRTRTRKLAAGDAPIDLVLFDCLVENIAGKIEIDGTRLTRHCFLEGHIDHLGNPTQLVNTFGPFCAGLQHR